ncbi:potassium transporter [Sinomicrobium pectinilyticum]|uniref:Potassium transporter n=1 Tax=Sinomicrobium pectinilyticum TaxID=1084421 RepID=A0A3N0E1H0_SINP1|nr:monovalent cation:proton antiporter-2 (CPA2) family protein [Sinomicrobium pectinilyticum]RNL81687.1 potassium transporter [Sinomicrobium pectinilyticum]
MHESFFIHAFIYLAGAVIMVPIAQYFKLGSVLGYLLAGIIIGPSFLKLVGEESQDVMHFAEFGVVMMLFVIGLELEPLRLWRLRRRIVGLGGAQLLSTALLVFIICSLLGLSWQVSLTLGTIISMSSTAIVLQILEEKGWNKTMAGRSAFAVLLFQDMAIIPILAILPLLSLNGGNTTTEETTLLGHLPGWGQTLAVIGAVTIIIVAGKYLLYPVFRAMARTRLREMFTAIVLLLVVGIALLMHLVGLSPALGAFLGGVLLANSEYRHELESAIDPFKGLLLGLFFMTVGSTIDFKLVVQQPWIITGMVLGVILLKAAILLLLGKIFNIRNAQNFIFSLGLAQIGEFAFVLLSFSLGEGIISAELNSLMMATVAISMACTPLLMMFNEKFILTRLCAVSVDDKNKDYSDVEEEENPVIIAGYGHFGNTVGRFLQAHNIPVTVLDYDSDNVDFLRKVGLKVYFGDATRHDLLEIAGANKAEILIIAIGDEEKRMVLIETVKKHFPHLYLLVRAKDRNEAYNQMNAGMMHIYRESLDTSLRLGVDALKILGHKRHEAVRAAKTFFVHDEKTLKYLSSIRNNEEYIVAIREKMQELDILMKADREEFQVEVEEEDRTGGGKDFQVR